MVSRISLPNGLTVWAPNAFEAAVVYREVFTESTYESHGIVLRDNATVFDVGANVGLFSIRMATAYTGATVFAFEPIPAIFAALSRNLAEHAPRVRAFNVGLSDRAGEATFEVDRFMTTGSTMHPRMFDGGPCASSARWASAAIADFTKVEPNGPLRLIADGLARPITRPIAPAALAPIAVLLALRRSIFLQRPRCRLDTLSAMLLATGVGAVDLVKSTSKGLKSRSWTASTNATGCGCDSSSSRCTTSTADSRA